MRWIVPVVALVLGLAGCVFVKDPADKPSGEGRTLTVILRSIGGASGRVTADGTECASGTVLSRPDGASVTLASSDAMFQGFAVDCPGPACQRTTANTLILSMTADHRVQATFRPSVNLAFVTSVGIGAAMGGLVGADSHCRARADAAGLGGTTWRAWLTTSTVGARSRLAGARGWIRTDGMPVVDSVEALDRGATFYAPHIDEFGVDVVPKWGHGFVPVWSGTDPYVVSFDHTCNDWTSANSANAAWVGNAASDVGWAGSHALYACEGWQLPLYCFETDYSTPVTVPRPPDGSRIAFLAQSFLPSPGGSIADADRRCMLDASVAGLDGSFKALLADVGKAPLLRFDVAKSPWYRLDGVAIVKHATDYLIAGGPILLATIDLAADGHTRAAPLSAAWVGFGGNYDDYGFPGTAETTCNGWSSNSPSAVGISSVVDFTFKSFEKLPNWPVPSCNQAAALYCLQE